MATELRRRKKSDEMYKEKNNQELAIEKKKDAIDKVVLKGSYWLSRIVFLRSLAFIYFVAFLVAFHQNKQLLGKYGLLPADKYLKMIKNHFGKNNLNNAFLNIPTILLFIDENDIDWWLDVVAFSGMFLSGLVFICGASSMIIMLTLWILYHAIVNIGQTWYSFGWESQLLETGFLAIFLCPFCRITQLPAETPPSWVIIWASRWLIFRIMIGAGAIKMRGDVCWRELTCMNYHYQTQPVPNPVSYYLHQSPEFVHKFETASNHFIELIAPAFLLLTRRLRIIGALLQILFQVVLIISGNLSFLNWLTILPSILCLDDLFISSFFSEKSVHKAIIRQKQMMRDNIKKTIGSRLTALSEHGLAVLFMVLSIPVMQNLLTSEQVMNTSFDSFRILNTYGAFGSVTKTRTEVVLQGTRNLTILPDEQGGLWKEYEFKCKPGDVSRRPCLISPYHYRLDWLMWFAAFMDYEQNPWLIHLIAKLLVNDRNVTSLIAHNPFIDGRPPRFIRAEHYEYEYTKIGSEEAKKHWWKRKRVGSYFPAVGLKGLEEFLLGHGWDIPINKYKFKM